MNLQTFNKFPRAKAKMYLCSPNVYIYRVLKTVKKRKGCAANSVGLSQILASMLQHCSVASSSV